MAQQMLFPKRLGFYIKDPTNKRAVAWVDFKERTLGCAGHSTGLGHGAATVPFQATDAHFVFRLSPSAPADPFTADPVF